MNKNLLIAGFALSFLMSSVSIANTAKRKMVKSIKGTEVTGKTMPGYGDAIFPASVTAVSPQGENTSLWEFISVERNKILFEDMPDTSFAEARASLVSNQFGQKKSSKSPTEIMAEISDWNQQAEKSRKTELKSAALKLADRISNSDIDFDRYPKQELEKLKAFGVKTNITTKSDLVAVLRSSADNRMLEEIYASATTAFLTANFENFPEDKRPRVVSIKWTRPGHAIEQTDSVYIVPGKKTDAVKELTGRPAVTRSDLFAETHRLKARGVGKKLGPAKAAN